MAVCLAWLLKVGKMLVVGFSLDVSMISYLAYFEGIFVLFGYVVWFIKRKDGVYFIER